MTVPSDINKSGPYNGNGVTTVFEYKFRIVNRDHLRVVKRNSSGVETVLAIDADYDVSGVGNDAGGQVETVVPPVAGETITILRNVPFVQETDLQNQGPYYAETVEDALDLGAMRDQQLSERLDRAVVIPVSSDPSSLERLIGDIIRLADSVDEIDVVANISVQVTKVANIAPEVVIVAGIAPAVVKVAAIDLAVVAVAGNELNINDVAGNAANINAVAGNEGNIDAVAGNATNINAVAANKTNIDKVAAVDASVSAVAAVDDEVVAVAGNTANINAVAGNETNINAVAANKTNIDKVAAVDASVSAVAAVDDEVVAVAGNKANIDAVAGNATNINAVAANKTNIDKVAAVDASVSAVAAVDDEVVAVAGNKANIDAVAGNATNINAVAGNKANIDAVAGSATNINTVAGDTDEINALAPISANISAVAGVASDIPTVAANVTDIKNFADVYQGAKTADPATRNDSSALQKGDLYFNTTSDQLKIFDGASWQSVTDQALSISTKSFVGDGSQKAFTLDLAPGTASNLFVEVGGVLQRPDVDYTVSGVALTLATAPGNGVDVNTWVFATTAEIAVPSAGSVTETSLSPALSADLARQDDLDGKIDVAGETGIGGFKSVFHYLPDITGGSITPDTTVSNFQVAWVSAAWEIIAPPVDDYAAYEISLMIINEPGAGPVTITNFSNNDIGTYDPAVDLMHEFLIKVRGPTRELFIRKVVT